MNSFKNNYLEYFSLSHGLIKSIKSIGEFKGKQDLYKTQSPQLLETLKQTAIIQSTESSNRIEGITAPFEVIKKIVENKVKPSNRSEQEIAGYRDVLNTIHTSFKDISFTDNVVLQFHQQLYTFTGERGGKWKMTDNEITEKRPDGKIIVRFKTVPAFQTANYMRELHRAFNDEIKNNNIDALILIPAYILDFLCIHPFRDGNGRISRLLALLLLYQCGIEVGRFVSLEKIIENSKETYYDALKKSSAKWHEGKHNIIPWIEYFYGMLLSAYKEFENRAGMIVSARGTKSYLVLDAINNLKGDFTIRQLQEKCPVVRIDWIRKILKDERIKGNIISLSRGKDAKWRKIK
jgi:Fic family protein